MSLVVRKQYMYCSISSFRTTDDNASIAKHLNDRSGHPSYSHYRRQLKSNTPTPTPCQIVRMSKYASLCACASRDQILPTLPSTPSANLACRRRWAMPSGTLNPKSPVFANLISFGHINRSFVIHCGFEMPPSIAFASRLYGSGWPAVVQES